MLSRLAKRLWLRTACHQTTYPGVNAPMSTINMINEFLDWAQTQQDGKSAASADAIIHHLILVTVWIVSTGQVLDWVRHPVTKDQLNSLDSFKCTTPQVSAKVCNGMPANEAGLLSHCPFPDFPFFTCVSANCRQSDTGEQYLTFR